MAVFEGTESSNDFKINSAMRGNDEVATSVPPRYSFPKEVTNATQRSIFPLTRNIVIMSGNQETHHTLQRQLNNTIPSSALATRT